MEESTKNKWIIFAWTLIVIMVILAIVTVIINIGSLVTSLEDSYINKNEARNIAIINIVVIIFISLAGPIGISILSGIGNS